MAVNVRHLFSVHTKKKCSSIRYNFLIKMLFMSQDKSGLVNSLSCAAVCIKKVLLFCRLKRKHRMTINVCAFFDQGFVTDANNTSEAGEP
jgi:hypothetical protein